MAVIGVALLGCFSFNSVEPEANMIEFTCPEVAQVTQVKTRRWSILDALSPTLGPWDIQVSENTYIINVFFKWKQ